MSKTRDSTPKYEAVHESSGVVVITGVSKTDARKVASAMGPKGFHVRPVRRQAKECQ